MSKWARVNLEKESPVSEVITYNPVGVINEAFLPEFKECPEETEVGYVYNPKTNTFYLPEGYAKHPEFDKFGYVPQGDNELDENGFIIFPPPPKQFTLEDFRSKLTISEKVLWDNPETGTITQKAAIATVKNEFPLTYGTEETTSIMDFLVEKEVFTTERMGDILYSLAN